MAFKKNYGRKTGAPYKRYPKKRNYKKKKYYAKKKKY